MADRFDRPPSGEPLGGRVYRCDTALKVGGDHRVGDARQGGEEPLAVGPLLFEHVAGLRVAGPGAAARSPQGLAEQGEGQADDEEGQGHLPPVAEDRHRAARLQVEAVDGQPGEADGQDGRAETAVPGGVDDGDEEGEQQESVAEERVEGDPDRRRQGDPGHGDEVTPWRVRRGEGHAIAAWMEPTGQGTSSTRRRPTIDRCGSSGGVTVRVRVVAP